jgi:hypothetical protein
MKTPSELAAETCKALNLPPEGHASLAIEQAILEDRAQSPDTLRAELQQAQKDRDSWLQQFMERGDQLRAISAGLSFDPNVDRDLECCARRIYNENIDLRFAANGLRAKLARYEPEKLP